MKILAIETSCDDTGISILEVRSTKPDFKVLSNIVSSQTQVHQKYGGVYPMFAKREHQRNLLPVLIQVLKQAKLLNKKLKIKNQNDILKIKNILKKEENLYNDLKQLLEKYEKPDIDLIAVTEGPGLEPCLWVGVNFVKALSFFWNIPIVPVNHIEAHILVNYLDLPADEAGNSNINFPAISLVVSGGHTQLILMKGIGKYQILGETRDDAAGECFDKCAKILGLGYPGGPIISKIASEFRKTNYLKNRRPSIFQDVELPRPMISTKDYDFSFSGLKTAVLYKVKNYKNKSFSNQPSGCPAGQARELENGLDQRLNKQFISEMCFEVQQAIIDVLLKKTIKAAKDYKAKTIILGGGVSANQELRKQLKEKVRKEIPDCDFLVPEPILSTDNALMIAITGYFYKNETTDWKKLVAKANLRIS